MAVATILQAWQMVPYTPSVAKAAGLIVVVNDRIGVVKNAIAANAPGYLAVGCLAQFPKSTAGSSAIADGVKVFWNAGSGIISTTASDGPLLGVTVGASVDADATQAVLLAPHGAALSATAAAVVAALTDNGGGATADGTIGAITPTSAGLTVTDGAGTNDLTIGAITADASVIAAVQELAAAINTNRTALIAAKDAIKELSTKVNEIVAGQKTAGQMASS